MTNNAPLSDNAPLGTAPPPDKRAFWVDDAPIRGEGAVKLVTIKGATVAWVRSPPPGSRTGRWPYQAGRAHGGTARDKAEGIRICEHWASSREYTIVQNAQVVGIP